MSNAAEAAPSYAGEGPHSHTVREAVHTDDKGRVIPADMDDRELAEETLTRLRVLCDVFEALGSHPLAAGMIPGVKF